MDFDNLGAFVLSATALTTIDLVIDALDDNANAQIRRLTRRVKAADSGTGNAAVLLTVVIAGTSLNAGDLTKSSATAIAIGEFSFPLEIILALVVLLVLCLVEQLGV